MPAALVAASLAVTGHVQFWHRSCDVDGLCGLPAAVSDRVAVTGDIEAPAGPGRLGFFGTDVAEGDMALRFELYWKGEDAQGVPYLAVQATVKRTIDDQLRPLAQCNTFHDLPTAGAFFPAGVCGGFVPHATGYDEWGVTFYRAP